MAILIDNPFTPPAHTDSTYVCIAEPVQFVSGGAK